MRYVKQTAAAEHAEAEDRKITKSLQGLLEDKRLLANGTRACRAHLVAWE